MERRAFRRYRVEPLLARTIPQIEGVCVLRDVSLSGALFLSPAPPPVGSRLGIEFSEEPLDGYSLFGKVVRHESSRVRGFGVAFETPHPKLLRAVYREILPD
jgi:hypothetical protein